MRVWLQVQGRGHWGMRQGRPDNRGSSAVRAVPVRRTSAVSKWDDSDNVIRDTSLRAEGGIGLLRHSAYLSSLWPKVTHGRADVGSSEP